MPRTRLSSSSLRHYYGKINIEASQFIFRRNTDHIKAYVIVRSKSRSRIEKTVFYLASRCSRTPSVQDRRVLFSIRGVAWWFRRANRRDKESLPELVTGELPQAYKDVKTRRRRGLLLTRTVLIYIFLPLPVRLYSLHSQGYIRI